MIFSQAFTNMSIWLGKTTNKEIEAAITDLVLEYRRGTYKQDNDNDSDNDEIGDLICHAMD